MHQETCFRLTAVGAGVERDNLRRFAGRESSEVPSAGPDRKHDSDSRERSRDIHCFLVKCKLQWIKKREIW
jgi:hypothetical protein